MKLERGYRRFLRLRPRSPADIERAIDDEIEAHIALRTEALIARGVAPQLARAEAVRRFGDVADARERLIAELKDRSVRTQRSEWLDGLRRDFGYALRQLRRAPAYALFALATLALGIGVTTATFTLVDGVLIRSLPFADPDRLYGLQSVDSAGNTFDYVSQANFVDWRAQSHTLESAALYWPADLPVRSSGETVRAPAMTVTADFFRTLGTRMVAGRGFTDADANATVAVVSESLWRRLLDGAPPGTQPLFIDRQPYTVVGVVARGQEFPVGTELWTVTRYQPAHGALRNWVNWWAVARVKPGVTQSQAKQDLDAIAARIEAEDPAGMYSHGVGVQPLKAAVIGEAGGYLGLLLAAGLLVLLIACANLAGVNLARGASRGREMAVRAALGAGRARLIRQLLVEHVTLAVIGGAAGIALAAFLVKLVLSSGDVTLPRATEIHIDARVLAFALALSIFAGLLTGVLPALQVTRSALRDRLAAARGDVTGGRNLPGAALVAIEVALALILLIGSGLLVRSYTTLLGRDLGFHTRNVITAQVRVSRPDWFRTPDQFAIYWSGLLGSLQTIPGAVAVGASNSVPLHPSAGTGFIDVQGRTLPPGSGAGYRAITEDYLRALEVPLVAGRWFERSDDAQTERVVLINASMARAYWPGESPLGRYVRATSMESYEPMGGKPAQWLRIIGIVGDIRHWGHDSEALPEMYTLYRQVPLNAFQMTAVVRSALPVAQMMPAIQQRLRQYDPDLPTDLKTLEQSLDGSLGRRTFIMSVLTGFGVLSLLLAAIGIYGLISLAVSQRTREIAVRAALGAQRSDLLRMVLHNALAIVALGALAGLIASLALTRLIGVMLVEVSPTDPIAIAVALGCILTAALAAAGIPALRAARTDPLRALQGE